MKLFFKSETVWKEALEESPGREGRKHVLRCVWRVETFLLSMSDEADLPGLDVVRDLVLSQVWSHS